MVVLALAEEIDFLLAKTLGVLNSCGFRTIVVNKKYLKFFSKEETILLGKHPKKKVKNGSKSRRRFTFYRHHGFCAIGYAEGARMDFLWWRDLFHKIRRLVWDKGNYSLILPLEKLRELGS